MPPKKKTSNSPLSAPQLRIHILNLIKDDLKNTRLVAGLDDLGLDSGKYYLALGETIFALLQLGENEALFEAYSDSLSCVLDINIFEEPEALERLASSIYTLLEKAKREQKPRVLAKQ